MTDITAQDLMARLESTDECALIDVREEGIFGANHILMAVSIPLSRIEVRIADLVPRASTPITVCDGGEGLAKRAAKLLSSFGYSDVTVLAGGVDAWGAAGYELFSGMNVPSKAFGEFVEHAYGTPSISAEELKSIMESGRKMVVLDSRPMAEFELMNIPTGVDVPGAELVYRLHDVTPDPDTLVVVNCAGRTRSIIGAQSLINAGVPNEVVALRNGTMGWHLAGYKLEHGEHRPSPDVSEDGGRIARERAQAAADRFGVKPIDSKTLDQWREEADDRTLYILDVRTVEEFETGYVADSCHAPGGQLVQGTDTYMATRNARVVLVDEQEVRAQMTASWLVQLGWTDVRVLSDGMKDQKFAAGPRKVPALGLPSVFEVSPKEASDMLSDGEVSIVDVQPSLKYRENHIAGAWFAIRARFAEDLAKVPGKLIMTSPDDTLACFAAADAALLGRDVAVLTGGTKAWEAAGLEMAMGMENLASAPEDVFMKPYDRSNRVEAEAAMNDYLTWEIALVEQISRPGGVSFKTYA
jgi:rhodanese-related sulfurtransferase